MGVDDGVHVRKIKAWNFVKVHFLDTCRTTVLLNLGHVFWEILWPFHKKYL